MIYLKNSPIKTGLISLLCLVLPFMFSGCCLSLKNKSISPLELQALQSRDYEAAKEGVFSSVVSVLQDKGFILRSIDKESGLISGDGVYKGDLLSALFFQFSREKQVKMNAFIETIGTKTRVRLNFVLMKNTKFFYHHQQVYRSDEVILDPAYYQEFFSQIDSTIFLRENT